jgi:hypothetical protein
MNLYKEVSHDAPHRIGVLQPGVAIREMARHWVGADDPRADCRGLWISTPRGWAHVVDASTVHATPAADGVRWRNRAAVAVTVHLEPARDNYCIDVVAPGRSAVGGDLRVRLGACWVETREPHGHCRVGDGECAWLAPEPVSGGTTAMVWRANERATRAGSAPRSRTPSPGLVTEPTAYHPAMHASPLSARGGRANSRADPPPVAAAGTAAVAADDDDDAAGSQPTHTKVAAALPPAELAPAAMPTGDAAPHGARSPSPNRAASQRARSPSVPASVQMPTKRNDVALVVRSVEGRKGAAPRFVPSVLAWGHEFSYGAKGSVATPVDRARVEAIQNTSFAVELKGSTRLGEAEMLRVFKNVVARNFSAKDFAAGGGREGAFCEALLRALLYSGAAAATPTYVAAWIV